MCRTKFGQLAFVILMFTGIQVAQAEARFHPPFEVTGSVINNHDGDTIKLDGSFVREIETSPRLRTIVEGSIRLAHELGMTFGQWRQQARLLAALERLAVGDKVVALGTHLLTPGMAVQELAP